MMTPKLQAEVVLKWLADESRSHGERCYPFSSMVDGLGLDRKKVRRACRLLWRKGLAEFHVALCDDDGEFRGAGYCISQAGLDLINRRLDD
jgi:hypothetical protein